jgi:hypothetical protein
MLFFQAFISNAMRMKTAYQVQNVRLRPTAPPLQTYPKRVSAKKVLKKKIMNAAVSIATHYYTPCCCDEISIFHQAETQHEDTIKI